METYPASHRSRGARSWPFLAPLLVALALCATTPAHADSSALGHVPNRVLVQFSDDTPRGERRAIAADAAGGIRRSETLGLPRTGVVRTAAGQSVREAARALRSRPDVEYAGPDHLLESYGLLPLDPLFATKQWALAEVGGPQAWEVSTGDPGIRVAVIDSGIVSSHSDLDDNLWINRAEYENGNASNGIDDDGNGYVDDWRGWNSYRQTNEFVDPLGSHGTGVAGILGAVGDNGIGGSGLNWHTSIVPVQADNLLSGRGGYPTSSVIRAINYAAHGAHAKVISMSIGSYEADPLMSQAISNAPDSLFVAAAGNDGKDVDVEPSYPCSYPQPNVICVAATDQDNRLAVWDALHTSNFGDTNVDLAAPGKDVLTTGLLNRFVYMWGTSAATPMVSGVAALLYSRAPWASPSLVRRAILHTVKPQPALAGKVASGGRLDAAAALALTTRLP